MFFSSILQIWYVEVRISRTVSEGPFDFEITRVDCIFWLELFLRVISITNYFLVRTVVLVLTVYDVEPHYRCQWSSVIEKSVDLDQTASEYSIYPAIRRFFFSLEWLQMTKSVMWNFAINQVLPFRNNPKDLDPSYKRDLDFWNCFGSKKRNSSCNQRNKVTVKYGSALFMTVSSFTFSTWQSSIDYKNHRIYSAIRHFFPL